VLPILGRLEYLVTLRHNLTLNLGAGWGGYVLYSTVTSTQTQVYVQDYDPWRPGDIQKNVIRTHLCAITPGGEAMAELIFELYRHVSLGLSGRMIMTSKVKDQWESSGYYATDWDPAQPELITITEGYEYGGVGWGLGVVVSLGVP
jgi:hypothetical protein